MKLPKSVNILDTTLRDGEQAPGVVFTVDEKIQIAQRLDKIGVNSIEVGFPRVSDAEKVSARVIKDLGLNANIYGLSRVLKEDIDALIDSDLSYMHTFIGTSKLHRDYKLKMSKEEILEKAVYAIEYGKDHGISVEFSAEDATRTEEDYLMDVYKAAESAGANILNVPDTVGILFPSAIKELITKIKENIKIPISIHCHNDFGLAVANSLMAIESGASQVHLTINGIGERAGNASLEEFVVALNIAYGYENLKIDTTQLFNLSEFVSKLTGIKIPINKPIVGGNAFAHESGIHVHGVLENTATYEPISPEMVGHTRKIALGKHTGANSLKSKLNEYNIEVDQKQFNQIYNQIKTLGDKGKTITDADLKAIAITTLGKANKESIKLLGLTVISGDTVSATATVKLSIDGKVEERSEIGVGPVDATLKAISKLVKGYIDVDLEEYNIDAITGGTDALAEVFVITSDSEGNKATGRSTQEDVILASVDAILNSINKIIAIK
ncbi:MAG: 2-isopropylmalate synthase [Methanobrevibacter sp.]|jgi:2-isopropylmalate synthase|nr:2-isopropylmalate synthase [Candidatus Methanovirga basalitermitum]